jgi:hypothetical protein
MITIAGTVSKGWMARALGVAFDRSYYFDPRERHAIDLRCNEILRQRLPELGLFFTESNLGQIDYYDSHQVLVGGIQPNMIVGMLLGADFVPADAMDADISPHCLAADDLAKLPDPETLIEHELIRQFDDQIEALRRDAAAQWQLIPPFFWDASGRAAVHGGLTTGLKFCGESLFIDMVTNPDRCTRLIDWLTDVSIRLVTHFAELASLPTRGIHVGECSVCLIDADHFKRYVVPATSRLGEAIGPVRFHSCGKSDHLIEACRGITHLDSLDVGGATSVAKIRAVFGRDFPVGIAPLVEDLAAGSPHAVVEWFERVARENDGGSLTIGYHLETDYPLDNIRALHAAVDTRSS